MKEIIQKYLENLTGSDNALKEKYDVDMLDGCINYLSDMARKYEKETNQSGTVAVPDEIVYHWAREYFVDGVAEKEKADKEERERAALLSKVRATVKNNIKNNLESIKKQAQMEFDF